MNRHVMGKSEHEKKRKIIIIIMKRKEYFT